MNKPHMNFFKNSRSTLLIRNHKLQCSLSTASARTRTAIANWQSPDFHSTDDAVEPIQSLKTAGNISYLSSFVRTYHTRGTVYPRTGTIPKPCVPSQSAPGVRLRVMQTIRAQPTAL